MGSEGLLQPTIVAAVMSAILGPLTFFLLKRADDRKRRTFDVRYAEYKRYLTALEQVSSSSRTDFEKFMAETYADCLKEILVTEGRSSEPILRLNKEVNELTKNVRESFTRATQELNGLRLVCSGKLFKMVNEFIALQRDLIDESVAMLDRIDKVDLKDPNSMTSERMTAKSAQAQELFEKIVLQMRKELEIK